MQRSIGNASARDVIRAAADGDSRRICGLSPIYAFLRVLPGIRGELLRYRQWPDPQGAVTYCAAAFA